MPFAPQAPTNAQLIPPARALRVTATYLVAFFNAFLNDQREEILNGPSREFPEITFDFGSARLP